MSCVASARVAVRRATLQRCSSLAQRAGRYIPHAVASVSAISPSVARARTASMMSGMSRAAISASPDALAAPSAASARDTAP